MLSGIGLIIAFMMPTGRKEEAIPAEELSLENCERMLVTEMATIDAEHEPEKI